MAAIFVTPLTGRLRATPDSRRNSSITPWSPHRDSLPRPELAVLDLADLFVLWNSDAQLTPSLYERLLRHFGDAGIVELGILGAFFMGFQRMLFAFDLVPREQSCPVAAYSEMAR